MLPHAVSFAVALVAVLALRFAPGPDRGPRLAGLGVALGLMAGLSLIAEFSWSAFGPVNRVGHIVLGAALVGVALDLLKPSTLWRWLIVAGFALGCGWASALGRLWPSSTPTVMQLGLVVLLGALWLGMMVRFSSLSSHKPTSFVVVIAVAAGLAVLASITNDEVLTFAALCLLAGLFALAVVALFIKIELSYAAMIPAAAALLATAWALSQRQSEALVGLPVLALVLFAERTARRAPMPGGRISDYLYLVVLAGCCAIPVVLAAVLVAAGVSA